MELEEGKEIVNNVVMGKIGEVKVVDRFGSSDNIVEVVVSNVEAYCLESRPTGSGNLTFDRYLEGGRLNKNVN